MADERPQVDVIVIATFSIIFLNYRDIFQDFVYAHKTIEWFMIETAFGDGHESAEGFARTDVQQVLGGSPLCGDSSHFVVVVHVVWCNIIAPAPAQ